MKLFRENIAYASRLIVVKEEFFDFNEFPFHYHPEYELILILQGAGKRLVGDHMGAFTSGDLYLLGPDLPHTFYNKHLTGCRKMHQVVVQFPGNFLGNNFFDKQPFHRIRDFLTNAVRGYSFSGHTLQMVKEHIIQLLQMDEAGMIIQLLSILDQLSKSTEFELLSRAGFSNKMDTDASERMSRIYDYVLNNFTEEISLTQIADIACLSPEAFCRYFKKHTRKTFSAFLAEMRVGYACKLLQENKLGVTQVSMNAGFNNISYFNRKFKALTKTTPLEYQRAFARQAIN
jgi:AraC-like DNA-binding protein